VERYAPLFYVSPSQVNYQIPPGTATGPATVTVTYENMSIATGTAQIAAVAPGVFAANQNARGVPAAVVARLRDGSLSYEPVAQFDAAQNKWVPIPLELGPETDQVILVLFGTGIRFRSSLSAVSVKIGGVEARVDYAGEQCCSVGLDQVNVLVPRSLAGRGEVTVELGVEGQVANTVTVNIL
jgi:uncharacterized protein (TIGR03437 family)